jgi:hypothetical protein
MERAFVIDKFNTFYDWSLILTAKEIALAEPKTKYIELDGASGSLDMTEALSGEVTYQDRTVSATFWTNEGDYASRNRLLRDIYTALHGKKVMIIEPDDTDHYFYGRVKVTPSVNNRAYLEFKIDATCDPWRYSLVESVRTISVKSQEVTSLVIHNNGSKTLCPEITVTGSVKVTYDGVMTSLTSGTYKVSDLKLKAGTNVIGVSGNGTVSFEYREADL